MLSSAAVLNPAALSSLGPSVILPYLSFSLSLSLSPSPLILIPLNLSYISLSFSSLFSTISLFSEVRIQTPDKRDTRGERVEGGAIDSHRAHVKHWDLEPLSETTPKSDTFDIIHTDSLIHTLWESCAWEELTAYISVILPLFLMWSFAVHVIRCHYDQFCQAFFLRFFEMKPEFL